MVCWRVGTYCCPWRDTTIHSVPARWVQWSPIVRSEVRRVRNVVAVTSKKKKRVPGIRANSSNYGRRLAPATGHMRSTLVVTVLAYYNLRSAMTSFGSVTPWYDTGRLGFGRDSRKKKAVGVLRRDLPIRTSWKSCMARQASIRNSRGPKTARRTTNRSSRKAQDSPSGDDGGTGAGAVFLTQDGEPRGR